MQKVEYKLTVYDPEDKGKPLANYYTDMPFMSISEGEIIERTDKNHGVIVENLIVLEVKHSFSNMNDNILHHIEIHTMGLQKYRNMMMREAELTAARRGTCL